MSQNIVSELCELLSEAGAKVSFSANCRSGIIGRSRCRCWRCLGVSPELEAADWDDVVGLIDRAQNFGFRMGRWAERNGGGERHE